MLTIPRWQLLSMPVNFYVNNVALHQPSLQTANDVKSIPRHVRCVNIVPTFPEYFHDENCMTSDTRLPPRNTEIT